MNQNSNLGLNFTLGLGFLAGIALIIGPFFVPQIPTASRTILMSFGIGIAILFAILVTITRLYVRSRADHAFVRTGIGGLKCVIDSGALVIPVIHQVKIVPTTTLKLEVDRTGPDALITADFLRADVKAVFYVRIQKEESSIVQAASSLPELSEGQAGVQHLINDKLISALRTVAAQQTLQNLNANRADFADAVQKIVAEDLKANGLSLESVTISNLDQAPLTAMRPEENVFDAQGAKTIAEQVQRQRVERNRIEAQASQHVKEQQVITAKYIAEQDVEQSKSMAEAESQKKIAQVEAEQRASIIQFEAESMKNIASAENSQKAKTAAAEQERIANIAQVQSNQQVELAKVEQSRTIELANHQREQMEQVALVESQKAVELAKRLQQIEVARAETDRAEASALQLIAQNKEEIASQEVETTRVVSQAQREQKKAIISKEAEVQQERIAHQMTADVAAYARMKEAEAEQLSAEKKAQAQLVLADAEKSAKMLQAEGEQALQMVPVSVAKEQVKVEDDRVAVKIRDLEGQAKFESIARELQVELAKIEAEKQARIAAAEAFGEAMAKANITVWGDPDALKKMSNSFGIGQSAGYLMDGLNASLPQNAKDLLTKLANMATNGNTPTEAVKPEETVL